MLTVPPAGSQPPSFRAMASGCTSPPTDKYIATPTGTPGASEPITAFTAFAANGQVSPDGKWLAFRRNDEIWVAPLSSQPIKEDTPFRFSPLGGHDFSFTPDGTSLVYSTGAERVAPSA